MFRADGVSKHDTACLQLWRTSTQTYKHQRAFCSRAANPAADEGLKCAFSKKQSSTDSLTFKNWQCESKITAISCDYQLYIANEAPLSDGRGDLKTHRCSTDLKTCLCKSDGDTVTSNEKVGLFTTRMVYPGGSFASPFPVPPSIRSPPHMCTLQDL